MAHFNVLELDGNDFDRISLHLDVIVEPAIEHQMGTPDYPALCQWDSHYVFVYDGLKHGFRRSRHLRDYDPLAVGWTKAHFKMWKTEGPNSYPIILLDSDLKEKAPVYGEVYQVTPETIRSLDWINSNTHMCRRFRMPIEAIIDTKGTSKQIYAWTYVHLQSYWSSRMNRLEPCDILTANNNGRKYYNYMKKYEQISSEAA
jgi:gamma-glutamylcyclotransferase (GGCT)/AIG2-like uncharacterized protein YtfP